MERITISVSDQFAAELAAFMQRERYENRSEAVRDLARLGLKTRALRDRDITGNCVATLSYVFDHHTRELPQRLTDTQHAHHDLHVATLHVHLDHDTCLEVAVLQGKAATVKDFARAVIAERGVTHGQVNFVPVTIDVAAHRHGSASHKHAHTHPKN